VTFDYGQTLAELDTAFLASRVRERGAHVDPEALERASASAWAAYDAAKARGEVAFPAWATFMRTLLDGAGVTMEVGAAQETTASLVDFLWAAQPTRNLWRRPIPGMVELVADLSARGVPLGIVSNSEGKLVELLGEMGLARYFPVVADSGVLGFEKPDPRIFEHVAERLGVPTTALVHVGDAWAADVEGALRVGARAIWVTGASEGRLLPPGVTTCRGATELRTALRRHGFPA
jgi:putative hydrolase of the HAD superfamily